MEKYTEWPSNFQPQKRTEIVGSVKYEGWSDRGVAEDVPQWVIKRTLGGGTTDVIEEWAGTGFQSAQALFRWTDRASLFSPDTSAPGDANPGPPIRVVIDSIPGDSFLRFGQASSVTAGAEVALITYTVPQGQILDLFRCNFSGTNIARYTATSDGVTFARAWTWFSGGLFGLFDFGPAGARFPSGTVIEILALHERPDPGDFHATLTGVLENA